MIIASGIEKRFGRNQVLCGVDLEIRPGSITAVLGPNGSGKTTLIKTILGMVVPQRGGITMDGRDILGTWQYRSAIGYLPQIARFPENLKVRELVKMVKDIRGLETGDRIESRQGLADHPLVNMFGLQPYLETPLRHLSGGTRQKVNILLTFMFGSKYYILDEPTAGLDPASMIRFKELLRDEKSKERSILLTTHILSLVEEIADEVVFLLEGKVHFRGTQSGLKALKGDRTMEQAIAHIHEGENNVQGS